MRRIRHAERLQRPPRTRTGRNPLARAVRFAWLAIAFAGCAFDRGNHVADGHAGASGVRQMLVCPLNLVVPLQAEVRRGAEPVDRTLLQYLESRGQDVSRLDRTEGRELWRRAVVASKSAGDPTRAPQVFVEELAQDRAFDAVVMPSLLVVQTRIDDSISEWDGVRRIMRMSHQPVIGLSPEDAAFATTPRAGLRIVEKFDGIDGQAWVASLHVLVYARDGSRVFEGRGGIDFLQEIEFVQPGKSLRYRLRPNGALFIDESALHEAVVEAFTPYLAPADA